MTDGPAPATVSGEHFHLRIDYSRRQIAIHGEFDTACTPQLAAAVLDLQHLGSGNITIRFDDVEFVDMAGLGSIIAARSAQLDRGDELVVSGANAQVRRMIELSGIAGLLKDHQVPPRADTEPTADRPPRLR